MHGYIYENCTIFSRAAMVNNHKVPFPEPALGPTQPPIQWVPGVPSLGIKRQWREADNSSPSSVEVKE